MRNLIEFPLLPTEVLEVLDRVIDDLTVHEHVGDIDIYAMLSIKAHLLARPWVLDDICDQAKRELINSKSG